MTCREISELLSAYLDDELDSVSRMNVEAHLHACERCRTTLEELRQVRSALQSLPSLEPPAGLHARIMQAVSAAAQRRPVTQVVETSTQRRAFSWKMPSFSRQGLRRAAMAIAACLVIAFLSSAGTLFWAQRHYSPLTARKESEGSSQEFRTMGAPEGGVQLFGFTQASGDSATKAAPPASPGSSGAESTADSLTIGADTAGIERKLIRRARLAVEVPKGSVQDVSKQAINIVRSYQGYIESSSISVSEGDRRSTAFYMTARVPSEHLDSAIDEISALGMVIQSDISEEDVTEQYVDLEARIRNKVQHEQRLLQIMGNASTVGELLQVEGELARVRAEIESLQGRLNVLDKSSAMSFLSVSIAEEGARKISPSPWKEIWETFVGAWQNLALLIAKISPAVILAAAGYLTVRRVVGKQK